MHKSAVMIRKARHFFTVHEMLVYSGYAAFCILMAMIPLLILGIAVINRIPGFSVEETAALIFERSRIVPEVRIMLESMIHSLNRQSDGFVALLSAMAALVSASRGISAIQLGLKTMQHEPKNFLRDKVTAIIFTLLYIIMIPALLIFQLFGKIVLELITAVTDLLSLPDIAGMMLMVFEYSGIFLIAANAFVILLTYTYLGGGKHDLKEYLPGAPYSFDFGPFHFSVFLLHTTVLESFQHIRFTGGIVSECNVAEHHHCDSVFRYGIQSGFCR